jgi:hypothetical protein
VDAKLRLTMNDIKIFDIGKDIASLMIIILANKKWESDSFSNYELNGIALEAPLRRMHHAADVYGCMFVVYGGFSGEEKEVMNDYSIYDLSKLSFLY